MFHKDAYSLVAMQGHGFFDSCYHVAHILDTSFVQVPHASFPTKFDFTPVHLHKNVMADGVVVVVVFAFTKY